MRCCVLTLIDTKARGWQFPQCDWGISFPNFANTNPVFDVYRSGVQWTAWEPLKASSIRRNGNVAFSPFGDVGAWSDCIPKLIVPLYALSTMCMSHGKIASHHLKSGRHQLRTIQRCDRSTRTSIIHGPRVTQHRHAHQQMLVLPISALV